MKKRLSKKYTAGVYLILSIITITIVSLHYGFSEDSEVLFYLLKIYQKKGD